MQEHAPEQQPFQALPDGNPETHEMMMERVAALEVKIDRLEERVAKFGPQP